MQEPLTPSTGWGVLHLFCRPTPLIDPAAITAAVKSCQTDDHQVVTVGILGRYLARVHEEVLERPLYLVDRVRQFG